MTPHQLFQEYNYNSVILGALKRAGCPSRYQQDLLQDVIEAALTTPSFQEAIDNQYITQWLIRVAFNMAGSFRKAQINRMILETDFNTDNEDSTNHQDKF